MWEVERPPKRQINLSRGVVVSAHWLVGLLNAKCLLKSHRAQAAGPRGPHKATLPGLGTLARCYDAKTRE